MINMDTYFSSQTGPMSEEFKYIPASFIEVLFEDFTIDANLEVHEVTVSMYETILEATLQSDIFHATLYDDREVNFE